MDKRPILIDFIMGAGIGGFAKTYKDAATGNIIDRDSVSITEARVESATIDYKAQTAEIVIDN